ncbi:MAG: BolA family transcriptional regulator [Planctomycetes bacterium]|nr:BolA family transcriptional regulator [Planctomycetota bacterium]MCB1042961.1 BolA family transcriptional regulator [Acidobacteriota bacterium]
METLDPSHLEVINESHQHNVPVDSESHFKVIAVSDQFEGLNRIQRHRKVNQLLAEPLQQGVHALSLHLWTSTEWMSRNGMVADSPNCRGGGSHTH